MKTEKRAIVAELAELRQDTGGRIYGYAAIFDSISRDLPFGREIIKPGAFRKALRENQDVLALRDHDVSKVLGRSKSGTLRLREDRRGLAVEIDPPDTELGRETLELLRRGDLAGMSFAFDLEPGKGDRIEQQDDGELIREVLQVRTLYDVSVVSTPAYEATVAEARNYEAVTDRIGGGTSIAYARAKIALAEAAGYNRNT